MITGKIQVWHVLAHPLCGPERCSQLLFTSWLFFGSIVALALFHWLHPLSLFGTARSYAKHFLVNAEECLPNQVLLFATTQPAAQDATLFTCVTYGPYNHLEISVRLVATTSILNDDSIDGLIYSYHHGFLRHSFSRPSSPL